jgi:hypothetical protein
MGFTIYYTSTRAVTAEEAETIKAAAQRECQRRSWLSSEPVCFFPGLQGRFLRGGSKPNLSPHADDKRSAESSGLPDGRPRDVIDILAGLSREHAIDWELMHDFGHVGAIRGGVVDPEVITQIEAIGGLARALGESEGEEFA